MSYGQMDSTTPYHVFLISNIADIDDPEVIEQFITFLNVEQDHFAVVVNGDLGEVGNPHLARLISWMTDRPSDRLLLLHGDRDWKDSGRGGWKHAKDMGEWVTSFDVPNVVFFQPTGCPDPEVITLDEHLQIIGVNTQWFNHPYSKPTSESSQCEVHEIDEFFERLEVLIDEHPEQNILIVGHYPIVSNGIYGGRYPLQDWIFPVPIFSGFKTSYRRHVGTPREINNKRFAKFRREMRELTLRRSSLIYASGHDRHNEILSNDQGYLINAGGWSSHSLVKRSRDTRFASEREGILRLSYHKDGHVYATNHTLGRSGFTAKLDTIELFQPPCEIPVEGLPINTRFVPCAFQLPALDEMVLEHDPTTSMAGRETKERSRFHMWLWGEHYADSWSEVIEAPIFNLDAPENRLSPYRVKSNRYKTSLEFENQDGVHYIFSPINSDPTKQAKLNFRNRIIDVLLSDQTTIRHPYGALTVNTMLDAAGLLHTSTTLGVLPDDPKLGQWRRDFANQLGILEAQPHFRSIQGSLHRADEVESTFTLLRRRYDDYHIQIDEKQYTKARIVDLLVGDWGRREENWRWAGYRQGASTVYRPIALDRDQIYTKWDGVVPWLADREWAKVFGETFEEDIKGLRSLTWQNRYLDRLLLNQVTLEDWKVAANEVRNKITPAVIHRALLQLPTSEDAVSKKEIRRKLTARRRRLDQFVERYYKLLSREVDVVGTHQADNIDIEMLEDGKMKVTVYDPEVSSEEPPAFYSRTFDSEYTTEVRIFGLDGSDRITLYHGPSGDHPIRLQIVPGNGRDSLLLEGRHRHAKRRYLYTLDGDYVADSTAIMMVKNADLSAYDYDRRAHQYNTYLPLAYLKFNSDQGLGLGARVTFKRYRYGQERYSSRHQVQLQTTTNGNLGIRYLPRWTRRVGQWDIIGRFDVEQARLFNFFFGRGQFEAYDDELRRERFYSLEYNTGGAGLGLSREFWNLSEASFLVNAIYNSDQSRTGNVVDDFPNTPGLESTFNLRTDLLLDIDLRDSEVLPYFGQRFFSTAYIGTDIRGDGGSFVTASSFVEMHNTFKPFSVGVRLGGAINIGDVPFFLSTYLGQNSYLRGFRQNRFLGDNYLFGNIDIRYEIIDNPIADLPYKFGLRGFVDSGQAYLRGAELEDSGWKAGYGFGFFFVPYKDQFTINLSAGFSREEAFLIQFGIGSSI